MSPETTSILAIAGWGHRAACWEPLAATGLPVEGHALPGLDGPQGEAGAGLVAAAEAFSGPWAVVVGWSLGGLVALEGLRQGLLRPRGLVLIATPPRFLAGPGFPAGMPAARFEAFRDGLAADPDATLKRFYALQFHGDRAPRSRWSGPRRRYLARDADPAALRGWLEALARADFARSPPALAVPVLAMHGDADRVVDPAAAAFWGDCGRRVVTATIAGAGHAPHISHPEETGKRIGEFVRTLG